MVGGGAEERRGGDGASTLALLGIASSARRWRRGRVEKGTGILGMEVGGGVMTGEGNSRGTVFVTVACKCFISIQTMLS